MINKIYRAKLNLDSHFKALSKAAQAGSVCAFAEAIDNFYSVASHFEELVTQLFEDRFSCEFVPDDFRPPCAEPSFEHIETCMKALRCHFGVNVLGHTNLTREWLGDLCQRSANLVAAVDWLVMKSAEDESADTDIEPDFSHRLSPLGDMGNPLALTDTISMMGHKADALLTLLGNHFAKDDDEDRPSDEAIYYALQSIRDEVADMVAVVSAFHRNAAVEVAP